jgi:2-iminobutanoate/2-iminopropanoate deaminase
MEKLLNNLLGELEKSYRCAQSVKLGNIVYISESIGYQQNGTVVSPYDMKEQIFLAYDDICKTLEAHGVTFKDVVKETLYMKDPDAADELADIRAEFHRDHIAKTEVEVSKLLSKELFLEVEVIAKLPARRVSA